MEEDAAAGTEDQSKTVEGLSGLSEALMDWRVWWFGVTLSFVSASLSFENFFPTLSATMSYNATISLHSDVTGDRFWHIAGPLLVGVVGFMTAMSTMNTAVRYLSLFLMTQSSVAYVIFLTWVLNTFSQSRSKRAAAIALINSMYFWSPSWGPSYVNSYLICMLTSTVSIAMCWALRRHLSWCNEAAEAEEHALGLPKGFGYLL
ncbi:hypothetical protein BDR07DRAFT_1470185 [Suillus spraguei]|nr:hypothetical protein BDR07DRAFT_1470185 [Suillus spraguei]